MKKIIYLFIILSFLLVTCKKKNEEDLSQYKASVYLSGNSWHASKVSFTLAANNTIWFNLSKFNEFNELREQIGLLNLNITKDTIFLKSWKPSLTWVTDSVVPAANFTTFLSDGDLIGDSYKVLESNNFRSWVLLNQISQDEISGKFQVSYVVKKRSNLVTMPLPDTINFTKGEFLARRR